MAGLEITIFEYELAGYNNINPTEEPSVFTKSLIAKKEGCPLIKVEGNNPIGETRSCDVLEGILSTDPPDDGPEIVKTFAQEIKITPEGLPPLYLSDLLLITTQSTTKLPNRPTRDDFNDVIDQSVHKDTFEQFYDLTLIPFLAKKIINILKVSWINMIQNVKAEINYLSKIKPSYTPSDLANILKKKGLASLSPSLEDSLKDDYSEPIANYTMIKYHTPRINDRYILIGDLHGSLGTFVRLLYRWKLLGFLDENGLIKKQSTGKLNILFLGDLSDRGVWGYEIYYTLFYLYIVNYENPNGEFFITRGNHEEIFMNTRDGLLSNINTIFDHSPISDQHPLHTLINRILSFFPSAHQIKYPNHSQFLYLAHGGYPLESTKTCDNPTVLSLPQKDVYLYDNDILINTEVSIRWNDFQSLHATTANPSRACAIGENTIEQAKNKNYMFTIRAHQDRLANTKLLLKAAVDDPDFSTMTVDDKDSVLENTGPKNLREVEIEELTTCPDGSTNCNGPIATLHVGLNSKIKINKNKEIEDTLLPVLTLTTNTDYGRDLFRDSYTIVTFKRRESCLSKIVPVPVGLSSSLQTLFKRIHELDLTMNDFISKLELFGTFDQSDIEKHELAICDAQAKLDAALKKYKDNVYDVGVNTTITIPSLQLQKEYENKKINGFTVEGSLKASNKRQALDKKYLPNDERVLVMYGFLERSAKGVIPVKDVTYDDIFDFLEWTTSKKRVGYPYLIAKWLSETRTKILNYGYILTIPLRTQQVLRDQLEQVEASLLVGKVSPSFLKANGTNPRELSKASGFTSYSSPPSPMVGGGDSSPSKQKFSPDQTNIYYKLLFDALNTLIGEYILYIKKLQELIELIGGTTKTIVIRGDTIPPLETAAVTAAVMAVAAGLGGSLGLPPGPPSGHTPPGPPSGHTSVPTPSGHTPVPTPPGPPSGPTPESTSSGFSSSGGGDPTGSPGPPGPPAAPPSAEADNAAVIAIAAALHSFIEITSSTPVTEVHDIEAEATAIATAVVASAIAPASPIAFTPPIAPASPIAFTSPIAPASPIVPTPPIAPASPIAPTPPIVPTSPIAPASPIAPTPPIAPAITTIPTEEENTAITAAIAAMSDTTPSAPHVVAAIDAAMSDTTPSAPLVVAAIDAAMSDTTPSAPHDVAATAAIIAASTLNPTPTSRSNSTIRSSSPMRGMVGGPVRIDSAKIISSVNSNK